MNLRVVNFCAEAQMHSGTFLFIYSFGPAFMLLHFIYFFFYICKENLILHWNSKYHSWWFIKTRQDKATVEVHSVPF